MTLASDITRSKEIDVTGLRVDKVQASLTVSEKHENPANTEAALEAEGMNTYMGLRRHVYGDSDVSIASEVIQRAVKGRGIGSKIDSVFKAKYSKEQRCTTFKVFGPLLLGVTRRVDSSGEIVKGLSNIRAVSVGKVGLSKTLGISERTIPQSTP